MKISETTRLASIITSQYGQDSFIDTIKNISYTNDLYIHIETSDGTIVFSPADDIIGRPYSYIKEMEMVKQDLLKNKGLSSSIIIPEASTGSNTLAYATYLHREKGSNVILYIFTPLFPVDSTVGILRDQLMYVTAISLIFAFIISFYLSHRISRPIKNITNSARELSKGNYRVKFQGGHYSEIIALADTLTYTSLELEKTYLLQKDLIANVSHDLRTPLTMVKSYAEMIRDLSGDNPLKRNAHIKVIIDEADRLNLLVDDMLTLSKMQSGVVSIEKSNFDLVEAVQGLIDSYALFVENEGYQLIFDSPSSIIINADKAKILQVFSNLLNNAVKYCGDDKQVIITLAENTDHIHCQVLDHGMGIPEDEVDNIWNRYYKASTNHVRSTTGSGLGLSIVKEILNQHASKYGVESHVGEGSLFWFELKK